MSRILVTGGAGFIGSHLTDAFIAAGHEVCVVDNLYSGFRHQVNSSARFIEMDIADRAIETIFLDFRPEVVVHQAAQMDVRKSVSDPMFDAKVNILGSINLLESCRKYEVRKVLFASTGGAIYGEQDYFPADENHPLRPVSPYGICKATVEKYLFYYHTVYGLSYISLRYGNIYGPKQNPHGEAGVIAIFAKKLLAGAQPVINGDGLQTRDYTFVGDVVKANLLALNHQGSGVFNVGTGHETTVNELFHLINSGLGTGANEVHAETKAGEQRRSVLSSAKIKSEMGWAPSTTLKDGLPETLRWFSETYRS
ncbi:MAG: NAD-dependent epimerase/dehydratase family protein [Bacteroidetes bacterium]|nr:NAD-dependent epimerase/dehydratase family protein [Bacteroidota bacterium]